MKRFLEEGGRVRPPCLTLSMRVLMGSHEKKDVINDQKNVINEGSHGTMSVSPSTVLLPLSNTTRPSSRSNLNPKAYRYT